MAAETAVALAAATVATAVARAMELVVVRAVVIPAVATVGLALALVATVEPEPDPRTAADPTVALAVMAGPVEETDDLRRAKGVGSLAGCVRRTRPSSCA